MYSYLPIPRDASPEFRRAIIAENTFFALRDSCNLRPGDAQAIHGERFGNVDTRVIHGPNLFESLFDIAERSPNTCEGSIGHLRDEYAWALRNDHRDCVQSNDLTGVRECQLDALDTLREWCKGVSA